MTAPSLVAAANTTTNITTTLSLSGCQAGDLLVVHVNASVDGSIGFAGVVDSSNSASLGTPSLDLHVTDGTRGLWFWSLVIPASLTAGAQVSVTMTGWPSTGTRRLSISAWRADSTSRVPQWGANRLVRYSDAAVESDCWTNDGSNIGHTTLTGTSSTRTRAGVAIMATQGGSAALTGYDFNADGTADSTNLYGTSPLSNLVQGGYILKDDGQTLASSGTKFQALGSQVGNVNIAAAVLYVLETLPQGRGAAAAKSGPANLHPVYMVRGIGKAAAAGTGQYGGAPALVRGIGKAAAKGFGRLVQLVTPVRGLGKAAAKGTGQLRVYQRGRGGAAASGQGYAYYQPPPVRATGKAAAQGSGRFRIVSSTMRGSGKAAAKGTGRLVVYVRGQGAAAATGTGRLVATGVIRGQGGNAASGTGRLVVLNTRMRGAGAAAARGTGRISVGQYLSATGRSAAAGTAIAFVRGPFAEATFTEGQHEATFRSGTHAATFEEAPA